jgi:hypothetical protein
MQQRIQKVRKLSVKKETEEGDTLVRTEQDTTELDDSVACCLEAIDEALADTEAEWTEEHIWRQIGINADNDARKRHGIPAESMDKADELIAALYQKAHTLGYSGLSMEEQARIDALSSCTC